MVSLRLARKEALSRRLRVASRVAHVAGEAVEQETAHVDGQLETPQLGAQLQGAEFALVVQLVKVEAHSPVETGREIRQLQPQLAARCSR